MERLTPRDLTLIVKELRRQRVLEDYTEQLSHWNFLAAIFMNGIHAFMSMFSKKKSGSKPVEPKDFLSKSGKKLYELLSTKEDKGEVKDKGKWDAHIKDAKIKGIKGPWGGEAN